MYGIVGLRFELQAELPDVIVNGSSGRVVLVTPDFVQKFGAGNHPPGILDKKFQKLELVRGHRDGLAVPNDFHFCEIDRDVSEYEYVADFGPGRAA